MDPIPTRNRASLLRAILLASAGLAAACGGGSSGPSEPASCDLRPCLGGYDAATARYTVGDVIPANAPVLDGAAATTWSVEPALPAGLSLDPATGVISGTPGVVTPAATYVVTAANGAGSSSSTLTIAVDDVAPRLLHYGVERVVYGVGQAIERNAPFSSGGAVTTWAVSPQLPPGLFLDPVTGAIWGTPDAARPAEPYTVTASNTGGSTSTTLTIEVASGLLLLAGAPADAAPAPGEAATFTVLPAGSGPFTYQWSRNGVDIPGATGSSYTLVASLDDAGAAFAVTAVDARGDRLTSAPAILRLNGVPRFVFAGNLEGSISTFVVQATSGRLVPVSRASTGMFKMQAMETDPGARYVYAAGYEGVVKAFSVGEGGSVVPLGSVPVAGPNGLATDSRARWVYSTERVSTETNVVAQFTVGSDGVLSRMTPPSVATNGEALSILVDPTSRFAFVSASGKGVSWFRIGSTGGLDPGGSTVPAASGGGAMAVDGATRWLYVANYSANSVSTFGIGPGGALTPGGSGPVATGDHPIDIVVHPASTAAYVTNQFANTVWQYPINAQTGALGSPVGVATGRMPAGMVMDPRGAYAYVACWEERGIWQYAVGADGRLTALSPAASYGDSRPRFLAMGGLGPAAPYARFAYAASMYDGVVAWYAVGDRGELTRQGSATSAPGSLPASVVIHPFGIAAYTPNFGSDDVSQFTVLADGSLKPMGSARVRAGSSPYAMVIDPSGQVAFVANAGSGDVTPFLVNAAGELTSGTPVAVGGKPYGLAMDPLGRFLFVTDHEQGVVKSFSFDGGARLTLASTITLAGTRPVGLAVDPTGRFLLVAASGTNQVLQFTVDPAGKLAAQNPASQPAGTAPSSVAVDPSGKYAYVANAGSNDVSQYAMDATGRLTPLATKTVAAGASPYAVTVDPGGSFVWVANYNGDKLSQYQIGAGGALVPLTTGRPDAARGTASVASLGGWR